MENLWIHRAQFITEEIRYLEKYIHGKIKVKVSVEEREGGGGVVKFAILQNRRYRREEEGRGGGMKERKRKRKDKGRRLVKGNGEKKRRRYSFLAACSVVSCKPLECLRYRSPRDDVRFFSLSSDHCPPSYIRYVPPLIQ